MLLLYKIILFYSYFKVFKIIILIWMNIYTVLIL